MVVVWGGGDRSVRGCDFPIGIVGSFFVVTQPNFQPFFCLFFSLSWSDSKCVEPVRARPEQTEAGVVEVGVGVFELANREEWGHACRAESDGTSPEP